MEILKKPREPWEIGIDKRLTQPDLLKTFYSRKHHLLNSRETRAINAKKSITKAFEDLQIKNRVEDAEIISNAVSLRNEFIGDGGQRSNRVWLLLSHIYDGRWQLDKKNNFSKISTIDKEKGLDYLLRVSKEHNKLYSETPSIECPIGTSGLSINIGYDTSNWEGIGAVYFFLQDENIKEEPVPAFAVRGNPLTDSIGEKIFEVNCIQGWLSDRHASVTGLKSIVQKRNGAKGVQELDNLLKRRDKLINRLSKYTDKSISARVQFITSASIIYLSNLGIKSFHGINPNLHPQTILQQGNLQEFPLDYDTLWKKLGFQYFSTSTDEIHPWQLNLSNDVDRQNFKTASLQFRSGAFATLQSISNLK